MKYLKFFLKNDCTKCQKLSTKKKLTSSHPPSHNVSSLKSWSFEFEEYSDFKNPLPKKMKIRLGLDGMSCN